jgi:hypothetical protein
MEAASRREATDAALRFYTTTHFPEIRLVDPWRHVCLEGCARSGLASPVLREVSGAREMPVKGNLPAVKIPG